MPAVPRGTVGPRSVPVVCGGVVYLKAQCGVRYWEDAVVDGVRDVDGSRIPCRVGTAADNTHLGGGTWAPTIEVETGRIVGWPSGTTARVHYKVCDDGYYELLDAHGAVLAHKSGYVPAVMCTDRDGNGDYVVMSIDAEGRIADWLVDFAGFNPVERPAQSDSDCRHRYLVLCKRDDAGLEAYPYSDLEQARGAYGVFSASWSCTYLVQVLAGPVDVVCPALPRLPDSVGELVAERDSLKLKVASLVKNEVREPPQPAETSPQKYFGAELSPGDLRDGVVVVDKSTYVDGFDDDYTFYPLYSAGSVEGQPAWWLAPEGGLFTAVYLEADLLRLFCVSGRPPHGPRRVPSAIPPKCRCGAYHHAGCHDGMCAY